MSLLNQLASRQDIRSEEPNKKLGRKLAASRDKKGIKEIAANLQNSDPKIQSDCLAVLEEVGRQDAKLIAPYWHEIFNLTKSRHNRHVWSAMIDLSLIADRQASELFPHVDEIMASIDSGSVITMDAGILVLAKIASQDKKFNTKILPYLLEHLRTVRPQSVAQHTESIALAVNEQNKHEFRKAAQSRLEHIRATQAKRVEKVLSKI